MKRPIFARIPWFRFLTESHMLWACCTLVMLALVTAIASAQESQAPRISIVSPIDGSVVLNTNGFELRIEADDPDGTVTRVALYRDNQYLGQALTEPYVFRFVDPPVGTNTYTAVATDNSGDTGQSVPVAVIVEAPLPPYFLPTATLTLSSTNLVLTAPAHLDLSASATVYRDGLDRFEFQAEYGPFGPTPLLAGERRSNPSYLSLKDLAVGEYRFRVLVRDIYGSSATSSDLRVTVIPPADLVVPAFRFQDLGVLGGQESSAMGVNELGAVVGTSTVDASSGEQRAFLWQTGVFRGFPMEGGMTYGLGLNDWGQVVGSIATGGRLAGAFLWTPARGMVPLPGVGPQSEAYSINRDSVVVGWSGDPNVARPVMWTPGSGPDSLPTVIELSPGRFGQARAINAAGRIAGYVSLTEFAPRQAVIWENGNERNLGVTAQLGGEWSQALGLNASGQVVGQVGYGGQQRQGFVWENGDAHLLTGLVGSATRAVAINDRGWSVGSSEPLPPVFLASHATLWLGRIPFDLGSLVTNRQEAILLSADALNHRGEIAGTAWIEGQRHAYLLTPTDLVPTAIPPTVQLASPQVGTTTQVGDPVTLLSSVTPGDHPIARVDYYSSHTVVATASESPFNATWSPSDAGESCLRAVAVDSAGNAGASAAVCVQVMPAAPRYTLANLGDLADRESRGMGLNSAGDFVGQARTDRGDVGFRFRSGVVTYFQAPGPTANQATDLNDAGDVLLQDNERIGIFQNGVVTELGAFPAGTRMSLGRAINNAGAVVGEGRIDNGETHAALFTGETAVDLGIGLGESSQANDINNAGVIVGWSQERPGQPALAFVRQPDGSRTQFSSAFGGSIAQATALNESGTVVGQATDGDGRLRAFIYDSSGMKSLGSLGGLSSIARDINNRGQIVGSAENEFLQRRAFLFEGGAMIDLNRLVAPTAPVQLTEAIAINEAGQILANGIPGPEQTSPRVFLLNPRPPAGSSNQPPSVALQFPEAGKVFYDGDDLLLRATAADSDGAVALVQFSVGGQSLGSAVRPPYEILWPQVPAGNYPVTVTAFDTFGASRTSAPVVLTVRAFNPSAPKVAIVGETTVPAGEDLRQNLRRTELFSRVDLLGPAPTLSLLMTYDSILVQSSTTAPMDDQLGNDLASYLDAGRGIAVALQASDDSKRILNGRIRVEGYLAWTNGLVSGHGRSTLIKDLPDHPVLAGVNNFDGGESAVFASEVELAPGTRRVASWSTGAPLVAVREFGAGRLVGLNLVPFSEAAGGIGWSTNSDGARLLGNALTWAAAASSNRFLIAPMVSNQFEYWPSQPISFAVQAPALPSEGVFQFFASGTLLGAVTNLPAQFTWSNAPVGVHRIVATYTNALGQWLTTTGMPITVDSRMSLSLLTPTQDAVYSLPTNILMQVLVTNQDASIVQVDYFLNDTQRIGTVLSSPFTFDFKLLPTGTFTVSAVATDALGAQRTSERHRVTVFNSELPQTTEWNSTNGPWHDPSRWTAGTPRTQDRAVIDQGTSDVAALGAVAASLVVGRNATASLFTSTSGLNVGGQVLLGQNPGSTGTFQLKAPGTAVAGEWVLGLEGEGRVLHQGGLLVADQLILSGNTGGIGTYTLDEGQLTVQSTIVGGNGLGQFQHRGGTHHVASELIVGNRNGSMGTYQFSGGNIRTAFESIGAPGHSADSGPAMVQTGGNQEVLQELRVGTSGGSGRLSILGGTLRAGRLTLDSSQLDLVAEPSTNRLTVTASAQLGGLLRVRLAEGYTPLGGDALTLMTYASHTGTFAATNLPAATNGIRWSLEYRDKALVLRALPPSEVVIVSALSAQPEAGLFHQTVTLSNLGSEELKGSRIYFPGLPPGWQLYNASGIEEGIPYVEIDVLIPAGSSIQRTVQFLIPGEERPSRQNFVVRLGEVSQAGAPALPFEIRQIQRLSEDSVQIQFSNGSNPLCRIEYSDDLIQWQSVPQPVLIPGTLTLWVDDGPPKTVQPPGRIGLRYYRVTAQPPSQ